MIPRNEASRKKAVSKEDYMMEGMNEQDLMDL
jgi:hypothetical protein